MSTSGNKSGSNNASNNDGHNANADNASKPGRPKISSNVKLSEKKVLIVDDNASDRLIIKAILAKLGINSIHEADGVNSAIYKLENASSSRKSFHLVISDWSMPVKSGYELLKLMRNDKGLKDTPVIMITATAESGRVAEAIAIGIQDFVVKPVEHQTLADKVEKLLLAPKLGK